MLLAYRQWCTDLIEWFHRIGNETIIMTTMIDTALCWPMLNIIALCWPMLNIIALCWPMLNISALCWPMLKYCLMPTISCLLVSSVELAPVALIFMLSWLPSYLPKALTKLPSYLPKALTKLPSYLPKALTKLPSYLPKALTILRCLMSLTTLAYINTYIHQWKNSTATHTLTCNMINNNITCNIIMIFHSHWLTHLLCMCTVALR